jgi:hypothetical protein
MIYDNCTPLGGQWHCPFPRWWVEMMRRAVKHCESLSAEYIERAIDKEWMSYRLPPGDFLSEAQDVRGLPMSWCEQEKRRHMGWPDSCTAIYNYDSVPEIVVTNGHDDWPLDMPGRMLTA